MDPVTLAKLDQISKSSPDAEPPRSSTPSSDKRVHPMPPQVDGVPSQAEAATWSNVTKLEGPEDESTTMEAGTAPQNDSAGRYMVQEMAPTRPSMDNVMARIRPRRPSHDEVVMNSLKSDYETMATRELGKGRFWKLKVFHLFPNLMFLTRLDHIFRVVFPFAYLIFVLTMLSEVGFGKEHYKLLETAPCYNKL